MIQSNLVEVRQTDTYAQWFEGLHDRQARARIDARIRRLSLGNPGDVKPIGEGVGLTDFDQVRLYHIGYTEATALLASLGSATRV